MGVPTNDELDLLHANLCSALSDPKRLLILYVLNEQPRHVNALAEALDMPQPTVSRHLRVLRQRGLVTGERDGTSITYALTDTRIIDVLEQMRALVRDIVSQRADVYLSA